MSRLFSLWQRFRLSLRDVIFSTNPRRRNLVGMSLLSVTLMVSSAAVMVMMAHASQSMYTEAVHWWAAVSSAGLLMIGAAIRSGFSEKFRDPSLTLPHMIWTIASGAVAYVLAGEARGLVPSVLAMILFFGTFSLTLTQVVGIGVYALAAFVIAISISTRFTAAPFGYLDTGYALMVLIVMSGSIALNLRIQRIRERLAKQRKALAEALRINRELASRDELTGLLNRRAMTDVMQFEERRSQRNSRPLLFAQLDIDHFKRINDTHGHATGDRALQAFASTVLNAVRDTDVLARWGGEEFVLMVTDTPCEHARDLLERIRLAVAAMEIPHATGTLHMTVSIGLAKHVPCDTLDHTLDRADQALYIAKALGRNRIAVAPTVTCVEAEADGNGDADVDVDVDADADADVDGREHWG